MEQKKRVYESPSIEVIQLVEGRAVYVSFLVITNRLKLVQKLLAADMQVQSLVLKASVVVMKMQSQVHQVEVVATQVQALVAGLINALCNK